MIRAFLIELPAFLSMAAFIFTFSLIIGALS